MNKGAPTAAAAADAGRLERPADLAQARELLAGTDGALLFRGGGTKLGWGAPPERVDVVVDTSELDRIVEHNAEEATAVVQAGVPLAALQEQLAQAGQWLAIDPPGLGDGATVGGILCTDDSGPRRHRYGTMRDLVIGTTVVLADGTVGRSGGKVIKNVAGYDLSKLLCGSFGTLGLVTEVILRLHPLSRASATLRAGAGVEEATELALALAASPAVPSAVDWAEGALWVRLEGHPEAVEQQTEAVRRLAAEVDVDELEALAGDEEEAAWDRLVAGLAGADGQTVLRAATLPGELPGAVRALREAADDGGVATRICSHAGVGVHTACLHGGGPEAHAQVLRRWRRELARIGGHVVVRDRPPGLDDPADVWGEPGPELELMRRIKKRFDPARRLAPGRYVGGI